MRRFALPSRSSSKRGNLSRPEQRASTYRAGPFRQAFSSLRGQAIVAVAMMLFALAATSTVAFRNQQKLSELQGRIRSLPRRTQSASEVVMAALRCQTRERDVLLARNVDERDRALRRWRAAEGRLEQLIGQCQKILTPKQLMKTNDWMPLAQQYREGFQRAIDSLPAVEQTAQVPAYREALATLVNQVEARRNVLGLSSDVKQQQIDSLLLTTMWWIVVRFFTAVLMIVTITLWFYRNVWRRLRRLGQAVDQVAAGNLEARVDDTPADELGSLARSFNKMAEAINRTHQRLKLEVIQHASTILDLSAAKDAAQVANRAKSEFLANMSHEIRTPMTAILGFTEILMSDCESPEARQAADTIRRNGEYLLNVINDILDLSKIEAGYLEIEQIPCSVSQMVHEVVALARIPADAKGLPVRIEFPTPLPATIRTDPTKFRQILLNLVGNAVKFTERGSVRVVVRLLAESGDRPMIRFDVIDTGIGIAADQLPKLFRPFTQSDSSTTRRFGGTGLGLTISKRLTEVLGGSIAVNSEFGQGSTFTVTIAAGSLAGVPMIQPQGAATAEPVARALPTAPITKLDCRVLLVEDGPDNQRLISFLLQRAGIEVTLASNGQEALELFGASRSAERGAHGFDIVLMDIQMPIMDGYEATRRLRAAGHRVPIIALTAHALVEDRQRCLANGFDDFITKPIQSERLIHCVAEQLRRARQEPADAGATSLAPATPA